MQDDVKRLAIVSIDKCKPSKCHLECKKNCPVVRMGKLCIQVSNKDEKALISELQCVGCGICIKKCPFHAIQIVNIPKKIEMDTVHKFGTNSFQLIHLPSPKPGQILGIIGSNGIGKSTALKILAGKIKPNLGNFIEPPDWKIIKKFFRGSDLQNFFELLTKDVFKIHIKPQYIDTIIEAKQNLVGDIFFSLNKTTNEKKILDNLCLSNILKRKIQDLSGGELQRFAIACTLIQKGEVFLFDEISSYLDVKQRIQAAKTIRNLLSENPGVYVIVIEHDLALVDYLSDSICCLYGIPGMYGIVTIPFPVKEGINIFLSGFIPNENMRFRENSITFASKNELNEQIYLKNQSQFFYPDIKKTFNAFKLIINSGHYSNSEIVVLFGENGTGKSSFVRLLGGIIKPDDNLFNFPKNRISYKPQKISPNFKGQVIKLLSEKIGNLMYDSFFKDNILNPLQIDSMLEKNLENLSGGELQRLSILLCLGKDSDLYLIDEPSSYLDSEQRLVISKILKKFITNSKKSAFIVEHDFIMATYLADQIIVFEGIPSLSCTASSPLSVNKGVNKFLKQLDITFRKDPVNFRPRINKHNSVKDREQKLSGDYYFDIS
jgi:ATP-binding cassette subfamily E protein 1